MNHVDVERDLIYLLMNIGLSQDLPPPGSAGNNALVDFFFDLLRNIGAPSLFCDIGGNDGSAAIRAKQNFSAARVISFEANPRIHQQYLQRLQAAGVEPVNVAVASKDGLANLYIPLTLTRGWDGKEVVDTTGVETSDTGKSSLLKRDEQATYEECTVTTVRLDTYLRDHIAESSGERKIALWIDVEGAAHEVLQGAEGTLQHASAIFIETESFRFWRDQKLGGDVAALLIDKGFIPVKRDREYADAQFNTVFVHNSFVNTLAPVLLKFHAQHLSDSGDAKMGQIDELTRRVSWHEQHEKDIVDQYEKLLTATHDQYEKLLTATREGGNQREKGISAAYEALLKTQREWYECRHTETINDYEHRLKQRGIVRLLRLGA
ncbi:FkbM family methyltransferase [Acidisphaera sp. S103]|uniref:FkbM family methyltransferase n=1 Tax=Acidisphaera sp. S103 TaxID=1747223 RepID=UPI00131E393C|nr:FkbM family methyltransferase [Acidisphaera sp. S103]